MTTDTAAAATAAADAWNTRDAQHRAAVEFQDADLTPEATARRKLERVNQADDAFGVAVDWARDQLAQASGPTMQSVLDARRPATADAAAVVGLEQGTIRTLLDAGISERDVLNEATEARLTALLTMVDVLPSVVTAPDRAAAAEDARAAVFRRLVDIGAADAVAAAEHEAAVAPLAAWVDALTEGQHGPVSLTTRQRIRATAPELYEATFGAAAGRLPIDSEVSRIRSNRPA
ncbi:hypothetical protein [Microbacterium sp. GXF7504]